MPDRPAPGGREAAPSRLRRRGPAGRSRPLALRLGLVFAAVALGAVAVLGGLAAAFTAADVSHLASAQRRQLTGALAVTAGAAWARHQQWRSADLAPVLDLAARTGAVVAVRDRHGATVAASPGFARTPGPRYTAAIAPGGQPAGTAVARFTGAGLAAADQALQQSLLRAIAGTAVLSALLALAAGLAAARRITRPLDQLTAAAAAMGAGDRSTRIGPVTGPGELAGLAAAFDQMATGLQRQEQLRRDLVADVAHELRTPVAVLQAGHEALLDGIAEPTPGQLSSLRDEVLRLGGLVGDLQTLAEADAAALRLDLAPADLAAVAAVAAGPLAAAYEAAGISLHLNLAPAPVRADAGRLHQVATNLLTNALKFTPAGGQVTMTTAAAGRHATLAVADTGPGIPAEDLPHVFERFWRGRQAAGTSGSGIGLAIAAGLARAHGGELTAASAPGQGTRLELVLPLA